MPSGQCCWESWEDRTSTKGPRRFSDCHGGLRPSQCLRVSRAPPPIPCFTTCVRSVSIKIPCPYFQPSTAYSILPYQIGGKKIPAQNKSSSEFKSIHTWPLSTPAQRYKTIYLFHSFIHSTDICRISSMNTALH